MRYLVPRILAVTGLAILLPGQAGAATYRCSPRGSDNNDGIRAPWRTLQRATETAQPGDTVLVADGNYPGDVVQKRSGRRDSPITYRAENAGRAVIREGTIGFLIDNSDWIVLDGLKVSQSAFRGVRILVSHHVTVRSCVFSGSGVEGLIAGYCNDLRLEKNESFSNGRGYPGYGPGKGHGIYVSSSGDRPVIENNSCHDNDGCGIQVNGFGDPDINGQLRGLMVDHVISDLVLRDNLIARNGRGGGAAINMQSVRDSLVYQNLVVHNLAGGIACFADYQGTAWGCRNVRLISNTIYFRPAEGRYGLQFLEGSRGNEVYNNLVFAGRGPAIEYDVDSGEQQGSGNHLHSAGGAEQVVKAGDLFLSLAAWQQRGRDRGAAGGSPERYFVNVNSRTADGFRLAPNSPARGGGVRLPQGLLALAEAPRGGPVDAGWSPAADRAMVTSRSADTDN